MARRPAQTLEHGENANADQEGFNPIDEEDDDDVALHQFIGSLEGDAGVAVTVYRVRPNKPLAYLFKCGATDFSLDKLRDDHGGGDFRVRAYRGRALIANKAITVEPPLPPKAALPVATPMGAYTQPNIEAILERQAMTNREMMLDFAKLMLAQRNHASDPRKEFFDTLTMVKGFLPAPNPDGGDGMDKFMRGIQFAREVADETGGGDDGGVGAIARLAEKYLPQIISVAQQPRAPHPQNPNAPRPQPMNPMMAMIRAQLDVMIKAAKNGQPNDGFVDEILDQLPPARVEELMAHADPVGVLISIHPGVAEVRDWFADLIAKIRVALTEDDDGADDPANADPQ